MVWYGVVWCGVVWYGMVWYGMVWYGMVWYGIYCLSGAFTYNFGISYTRFSLSPLKIVVKTKNRPSWVIRIIWHWKFTYLTFLGSCKSNLFLVIITFNIHTIVHLTKFTYIHVNMVWISWLFFIVSFI
jgi:hypothetical protein